MLLRIGRCVRNPKNVVCLVLSPFENDFCFSLWCVVWCVCVCVCVCWDVVLFLLLLLPFLSILSRNTTIDSHSPSFLVTFFSHFSSSSLPVSLIAALSPSHTHTHTHKTCTHTVLIDSPIGGHLSFRGLPIIGIEDYCDCGSALYPPCSPRSPPWPLMVPMHGAVSMIHVYY